MKKIMSIFACALFLGGTLVFSPIVQANEDNKSFTVEVKARPAATEKVSIDFEIDADGTSTRIDKDTNFTIDGDVSRGLLQDGRNVVIDAWKNHVVQPTAPSKARGSIQEDVGSDNKTYPVRQEIKTTTTTKVTQNKTSQGSVVKTQTTQNIENSYSSEGVQERPLADKREFLTFETATGKVFHLIIDREKNVEQVKLVTEVSEQDLLNMIEIPIPQPTMVVEVPVELSKETVEEPIQATKQEKTDWVFYAVGTVLLVVGVYGYKKYTEKTKTPKSFDKVSSEQEVSEEDMEENFSKK